MLQVHWLVPEPAHRIQNAGAIYVEEGVDDRQTVAVIEQECTDAPAPSLTDAVNSRRDLHHCSFQRVSADSRSALVPITPQRLTRV
jgi:hypothetical protein